MSLLQLSYIIVIIVIVSHYSCTKVAKSGENWYDEDTSDVSSSARVSCHGHDVWVISRDDDEGLLEVDQLQRSLDGMVKGHCLVHGLHSLSIWRFKSIISDIVF